MLTPKPHTMPLKPVLRNLAKIIPLKIIQKDSSVLDDLNYATMQEMVKA